MIDKFQGEYRFLSNFWPAKVILDGGPYFSVEHAYQAAKTINSMERRQIQAMVKPGDAKKSGKKVTQREDWGEIKIITMRFLLNQKFANAELRLKLLQTDGQELVEGNHWGDVFWGK